MGNCALRESFVQKQIYSAVISSHLKTMRWYMYLCESNVVC